MHNQVLVIYPSDVELEDQKIAEVIRPSKHIKISKTEKDPAKLERLYQLGVHDAKQFFTSCS